MKLHFLIVCIAAIFIACNGNNKNTQENNNKDVKTIVATDSVKTNLLGSFVGSFGANKITLLITKINGDTVEGNSIVAGNNRPFSGLSKITNGTYNIIAKEPGDDKYDGVFNILFDEKTPNTITGNWKTNNDSAHGGAKSFSLTRNEFKYLVDVGQFPQASKKILTDDDVNYLSAVDLNIMRNEIFARHGYCFKKKELRQLFEDKDWYIPNSVNVMNDLTDIEKQNLTKIKKFEKYAVEHGDDFGR